MVWVVTVGGLEIPERNEIDHIETSMTKTICNVDGIQDCWCVTRQNFYGNTWKIEFHVFAESMPGPKTIMEELVNNFNISFVVVTRKSWKRNLNLPFQWINNGVTVHSDGYTYHDDSWDFNVKDVPMFSVRYVESYTKEWTEETRRKKFGNAQFIWSTDSRDIPLSSSTIDDALLEVENLYKEMLHHSIQVSEKTVDNLKSELEEFTKWQEGKLIETE